MKKKFLLAAAASFFVMFLLINACSGNTKSRSLLVDDLLEHPELYVDQSISIEGVCSHVCSKSGMKMFLKSSNENRTIRAESNSSLGKFDQELIGKNMLIKGKFIEERITEADLQQMEEDIEKGIAHSHGEGEEGCENEQKSEGTPVGSSELERVNDFRTRIAERKASEGVDYLSLYHIDAESYRIIKN